MIQSVQQCRLVLLSLLLLCGVRIMTKQIKTQYLLLSGIFFEGTGYYIKIKEESTK